MELEAWRPEPEDSAGDPDGDAYDGEDLNQAKAETESERSGNQCLPVDAPVRQPQRDEQPDAGDARREDVERQEAIDPANPTSAPERVGRSSRRSALRM